MVLVHPAFFINVPKEDPDAREHVEDNQKQSELAEVAHDVLNCMLLKAP